MPRTEQQTNRKKGTLALLRDLVPDRRVSRSEALRVAELQAARLRQHLDVATDNFPLQTIVDLPRVEIRHDADLLHASGMSFWNGSNWIILIDPTEAKNRRRFSIVHEFKHIIDYRREYQLYGTEPKDRSPAAEHAANHFAACLLMPKLLVKRYWGRGPRSVTANAKRFKVSPSAMKYRLDQLGLIEPAPRCNWSAAAAAQPPPHLIERAAA